jgi:hypothetical protein
VAIIRDRLWMGWARVVSSGSVLIHGDLGSVSVTLVAVVGMHANTCDVCSPLCVAIADHTQCFFMPRCPEHNSSLTHLAHGGVRIHILIILIALVLLFRLSGE